jgi:hypothetical protein
MLVKSILNYPGIPVKHFLTDFFCYFLSTQKTSELFLEYGDLSLFSPRDLTHLGAPTCSGPHFRTNILPVEQTMESQPKMYTDRVSKIGFRDGRF